jgi:hypothetical protein
VIVSCKIFPWIICIVSPFGLLLEYPKNVSIWTFASLQLLSYPLSWGTLSPGPDLALCARLGSLFPPRGSDIQGSDSDTRLSKHSLLVHGSCGITLIFPCPPDAWNISESLWMLKRVIAARDVVHKVPLSLYLNIHVTGFHIFPCACTMSWISNTGYIPPSFPRREESHGYSRRVSIVILYRQ